MSGEYKSVLEDGPIEGEPLVSVCVITYNHGKYIRQCLDGILMQKVNFPYEVLIHDDASPDDTADIIREYWEKYPTVIKPILREENQYSKGVDVSRFNFDRAKAKYIAQCEGDDYWTDERKLQMQVDFLEGHGEYSGTGHYYWRIDKIGNKIPLGVNNLEQSAISSRVYTKKDVKYYRLPAHTATLVYKNIFSLMDTMTKEEYYLCKGYGDQKLSKILVLYGDIYIFPERLSIHRYVLFDGTSYTASTRDKNIYGDNYQHLVEITEYISKYFKTDLVTYPSAFCILCMIWIKAITSHTDDDIQTMQHTHKFIKKHKLYIIKMTKHLITHPILTANVMISMFKSYRDRVKYQRELIKIS